MEKHLPKNVVGRGFWVTCFFAVLCALSTSAAFGQSITVSGEVKAGDSPLPGVSIFEKGTSNGTAADAQGKFTLTVPPSAVLVFSFIGYKSVEMPVNSQTTININMEEDVTSLSEIVVTALGVEREVKSLGYAVQEVNGSSAVKAREPNVINSLTGKVAGLQIKNQTNMFQAPDIKLRGATPLIVIDGVPSVDNDIWKINADDVESYSVLKGATASALYGSIGRNGAIMITTKRGASGKKLSVDINSSTMFQPSFIRIPEVQSSYGNGYNGQYAYVDGSGSGLEGGGWIWGPKLDQRDNSTPSGFFETTQFNSPVDPVSGNLVPLPFISRGKDNVKNFFQTGMISTNNISVSGGGENGTFRISTSHTYQKGIVPNTQLNNSSFGLSGSYKVNEKLRTDASLTYNKQFTDNYPEVGYGPENYLYNLVLWTGPDVDVRDLRQYWVKGQEGVQQRHYNMSWYNNPYFQANEFLQGYHRDNVFGQFKLDYNVLPGLDLTLRTGVNQYTLNRSWKEPKSYVRYDIYSKGNYYLRSTNEFNINTDFLARYKLNINENISLTATAGGANRFRSFTEQYQYTDGLVIPQFFNMANSANPLRGTNRLESEQVNSVYGTLDMEFFGGIFFGATGRQDWVSTLPVQNNSFFYPALSLAGVITDFADLSDLRISFLKVRGSWSRVSDGRFNDGSDFSKKQGPYAHIQAYDPGINWNGQPSLRFPSTLIDPNLKPETSDTYEVGLDARFFEGRLGLDVAAYKVRDYNLITRAAVSEGSGFETRLVNGGEFTRKGIEITLMGTPVKTDKFAWDVVVNWSRFRKIRESFYGDAKKVDNIEAGTRDDQIWGFSYMRTPGGSLVLRSDGYPENDPFNRFLGYRDADYIFGFQNTFKYGDFSLTVAADGRIGGMMYSTTNQKMWWGGTHPGTVNQFRDDANAGIASYIAPGVIVVEGDIEYDADGKTVTDSRVYAPNTTPVNYIQWNISTSNALLNHYYDASFVKLREITLTYNFPSKWMSSTFMNRASISFVGRNLALWSNMPEVDPDPGDDNLQTPSTRNLGFNITLSF